MKELVSVVIPVYNVEKYLDRCLNSVVSQSYTNLDIILVDDGSTDSCPAICEKWAEKDDRVKVIHKPNAGLGMARNTGIENAKGQYICFFDSDDYVDIKTIETALFALKGCKADVAVFGMSVVDGNGNVYKSFVPRSERNYYCGKDVTDIFLPGVMRSDGTVEKIDNIRFSAWSFLFSTELLNKYDWRFVSEREIISEDVYSLLTLFRHVDSAVIVKEALYYYCENNSSLTRSYDADRFEKSKYFYQKCIELCTEYEYPVSVKRSCMSSFLGNTFASMKQAVEFNSKKADALKCLRTIIDDEMLQDVLCDKKRDKLSLNIQIFFWAAIHKYYFLCYLLLRANSVILKKKS